MSGDLVSEAKGRFAEMLISTILDYAGYRVMRLGVEEAVSEVKASHVRGEAPYRLPEQVQCAPDFLVMDVERGDSYVVEVKFRRTIDSRVADSLHRQLVRQASHWPETVTILVVGEPPGTKGDRYQDYIRAIASEDYDDLLFDESPARMWQRLRSLGSMFDRVHDRRDFHAQADRLIPAIRAWA